MVKDYRIVTCEYSLELQQEVRNLLRKGWRLQGGVSVYKGWFHQAMYKNGK